MRRHIPVLTAAALVALTGCGAAASASQHPSVGSVSTTAATVSTTPATATVTTTGTGSVSGTPDVMTVQIGVQSSGAHVAPALRANNMTAAAVQAALMRGGVAVADIQTSQLSLYPQQSANHVTRYQVTDEVTATLHDLSKAGTVIDDALAAAGDSGRLDGVSFSVANDSPLLAQARRRAVTAARTEAQQLAAAAGLKLIGLRSITDQNDQIPFYPQSSSGSAASSPAPVPVQPGTQQTTVQITAVWNVSS